MLIYKIDINALDGRAREEIEVTGSKLPYFTTVKRPDIHELKLKYNHTKNKMFYMTESGTKRSAAFVPKQFVKMSKVTRSLKKLLGVDNS